MVVNVAHLLIQTDSDDVSGDEADNGTGGGEGVGNGVGNDG